METVYCRTEREWRAWLKKNHAQQQAIWLVFYKNGNDKQSLDYESALMQALCFGWIDSVIKRIDRTKYVRKFTKRKIKSQWSESNRKRVGRLLNQGLLEPAGLLAVKNAKAYGTWKTQNRLIQSKKLPAGFQRELESNKKANANFDQLAAKLPKAIYNVDFDC